MSELRQEVEANYDNAMAEQMMASEGFKYYKSMGGEPDRRDTKQAGWSDEQHSMFVGLLNREAPDRMTLGEDLNRGLQEAGFNTTSEVNPDGTRVTTVGARNPQ